LLVWRSWWEGSAYIKSGAISPRCVGGRLAFAAVILQGVLGGLRVVWLKDQIGIFHAALAQLFLR